MLNKKILSFVILLSLFTLPVFVFSQGGASGLTYECFNNGLYGNCTFADLTAAVQNFVNQIIIIVLMLTVIPIAYAGFLYMTSGDIAGNRSKANEMLRKVAIGIFFMLAAWLIVNLIATALLSNEVRQVVPIGN